MAGHGSRAKATGDYVTDVDRESERAIGELLTAETPDIPLVGEEAGGTPTDRYWLVDPLDGTTNYLHGFPVVGVSIALIQDGRPIVGVVHAPFLGETYLTTAGGGATLAVGEERVPVRVSDRRPERAVLGTGFPFRQGRGTSPATSGCSIGACAVSRT